MRPRMPSIKTLTPVFAEAAVDARKLLVGDTSPEGYASVYAWLAQCFNRPSHHERLLCALNELANAYGVEAIFAGGATYPDYEYLNVGDMYLTTLIYDCRNARFFVGAIGDIVEKDNGKRYT